MYQTDCIALTKHCQTRPASDTLRQKDSARTYQASHPSLPSRPAFPLCSNVSPSLRMSSVQASGTESRAPTTRLFFAVAWVFKLPSSKELPAARTSSMSCKCDMNSGETSDNKVSVRRQRSCEQAYLVGPYKRVQL
jgi:hypothetical protein